MPVVGRATARAGGVTTSAGTGASPGRAGPGARGTSDSALTLPPDQSSGVSLADQSWSCPWPPQADSERIDEQTVVIRVVVTADGRVESADIVSDPGHGFGSAAVACALRTRFTPARDRAGQVVRALSPPIKVRFIR